MEEKLREYAHLIVSVGLNLQKGQTLILSSPWSARRSRGCACRRPMTSARARSC
ncbi:MAG: hypothetical protein ACLR4W_14610 [Oscillospiraceae bacterium]